MSIAALIRAMSSAGATPEAIAIAVEAIECANNADAERRAKQAARKRKQRDSRGTVAGQSQDNDGTVTTETPDKEKSPHTPLKEINPDTSLRSVSDIGASDCKAPKRENPATAFVGILSDETAKAVVAHRKAKKSPLTMRAAELLAKEFSATGRPEDAANAMIAHGWQGFKAEWLNREARAGPAPAQPARRGSAALFDAMDRIFPDAPDSQTIPSSAVLQLADHRQR